MICSTAGFAKTKAAPHIVRQDHFGEAVCHEPQFLLALTEGVLGQPDPIALTADAVSRQRRKGKKTEEDTGDDK